MQHNLQEIAMYEKEFKRFEELLETTQSAYEFLYNCWLTNWKNFTKSF